MHLFSFLKNLSFVLKNSNKGGLILKRIITIIIAVIILVAVITGIFIYRSSNSNTSDLHLIKVNEVTRSVFYAPQYIAISQGFFEKNGIEIVESNILDKDLYNASDHIPIIFQIKIS